MAGWNADTLAGSAGIGAVTIVEGSSFCISEANGDIESDRPQGAFFRDTRILSTNTLLINGKPVEPLSALTPEPFRAIYIGRPAPTGGKADTPLLVERHRRVARGMREDIIVRNFSIEPITFVLDLVLEADFADIFDVKERHQRLEVRSASRIKAGKLELYPHDGVRDEAVAIYAPGALIGDSLLTYAVTVPARGAWTRSVQYTPIIDGEEVREEFPTGLPLSDSEPERRLAKWRSQIPIPSLGDEDIERVLHRSHEDLGSLRMFDPEHPNRAVVAAGAPWFMALFGRDSLLTSLMSLSIDTSLALGTLQTLADLQGTDVDPLTEEQPGRILHEVRLGVTAGLALGGGSAYYGTADATPLFVVLLGELARWGHDAADIDALLPYADRALEWVERYGDSDSDGFVEYERMNEHGLINQGWKDSWDGIQFADGTIAEPPIALCEVQGYTYSAYLARAMLAKARGDHDGVTTWSTKAAALKKAFNEQFWMPDRGYYAIALDRDKKQVDACASNMGHCLWSGIVDDDKAAQVAKHLVSPAMFSGWGVRTLSADMASYNPVSYHNGTIWPHDNAIVTAGLMRYGFVEEARKVALAVLEAADHFDGRLPELFCGFDRASYPEPVPYPSSCSPQAWASAAPLYLFRSLLRLEPCVPAGGVWMSPVLPESFGNMHVDNLPLAGARLSFDVVGNEVAVAGLPSHLKLHREPRSVHADLEALAG